MHDWHGRRGGLHFGIGGDAAEFGFDAGFFQAKAGGIGNAAQGEEDFLITSAMLPFTGKK